VGLDRTRMIVVVIEFSVVLMLTQLVSDARTAVVQNIGTIPIIVSSPAVVFLDQEMVCEMLLLKWDMD